MSLLRELENRLESLFEGFFARQFKSGVQPVEIAKKLIREMDANRTVSVSKLYVPNRYTVLVSPTDAERLKQFEKDLVLEFQNFLISHAQAQGYSLVGRPQIRFKSSPKLALGEIIIRSSLESAAEPLSGKVELAGPSPAKERLIKKAYLVRSEPDGDIKISLEGRRLIKIGRASDNDIVITDPNVSRHHAQIEVEADGFVLKDTGSTNGTFVNGTKIGQRMLRHGDTVTIGMTKLRFRSSTNV